MTKNIITFEWVREDLTAVFKNGKRIGKIEKGSDNLFRYYQKNFSNFSGYPCLTLDECKNELLGE